MELFRTNGFLQPVTEYPVFVDHHEMLHVQIQVDSSDTSLQVFPLTCVATPSDKPDDKIQNDVIVDGCATLPTLQFYPSPGPDRWRFGFQAFAFGSGVGMVYLHCDVLLCNATDPNSRCAQGCLTSGGRTRREAGSESDIYRLIQGPIVFSDDQTEVKVSGTNTDHQYVVTASAILGACAVLTGAMFVVGIVYKARREGRQAGYKE
ncbi:ZP domain-containing protein-like [Branchiostoma floridae x Branchiostoma japonicum]